MRIAITLAAALLTAASLTAGHSYHSTHITSDDGRETELHIVRESDGESFATWKRDGVRWFTADASVLAAIDKAMEKYRHLSLEHREIGRRHRELGREHAALGRERARIGREHARAGRTAARAGYSAAAEDEQRRLEADQRELEAQQRALEHKQRDLEDEQRRLEDKQRAAEGDADRTIDQIFERAVREGKAKRQ